MRFVEADGSIADDTITVPGLKYSEKYSFKIPAVKGQVPTIDGAYVTAGDEYEVTVTGDTNVVVEYVDTVDFEFEETDPAAWNITLKDAPKTTMSAAGETITIHLQNDDWGQDASHSTETITIPVTVTGATADEVVYTAAVPTNNADGVDVEVILTDVVGDVTVTVGAIGFAS